MQSLRNRYLLFTDALLIGIAPLVGYALRFEGFAWGAVHRETALWFAALSVPTCLLTFFAFGLYRRLWRYASIAEVELIFAAVATADLLCWLLGVWVLPGTGLTEVRVPLSVLFA